MTFIYGLVDPRTQQLRYVGKTKTSIEKRLTGHLADKKRTHKSNWLRSLKSEGLLPEAFVIESVEGDGSKEEIHFIAYFKSLGCPLTNQTVGGEGRSGPLSTETRQRMSKAQTGRKHTAETKAKISQLKRGSRLPPRTSEHIEKLIAPLRGKPRSAATIRKISQSRMGIASRPAGFKHSEETRQKMRDAANRRWSRK